MFFYNFNELFAFIVLPEVREITPSLSLGIDNKAKRFEINGMQIEMLLIAHAFGEKMKKVENIIYRVILENGLTVMHFGDAETALDYYEFFYSV